MCGISGIICNDNFDIKSKSEIILKNILHRGPDDRGIIYRTLKNNFKLSMIHSRLSILDLSVSGKQPMVDSTSQNSIIFNGEIYNYKEIKKELIEEGYVFFTDTDTEVLMYSYDKWGKDLLSHIEGMFAFAIYDNKKKQIFLAVDHFGIKPLYWHKSENIFCFCSEIRPLLKSSLIEKKLNPIAIDSYFEFGAIQGPETIIENLNSLEAGHYLLVDFNGELIEYKKYWDINFLKKNDLTYDQTIEKLEVITKTVIQEQLVADAPLGIFLSGGIDSSVLTYFTSLFKKSVNTFTVSFDNKKFNEGEIAKKTANKFFTNHKEILVSPTILKENISEFINSLDQPTIDGLNIFTISKIVKSEGIKTVLSGQGGDEIFGGYSTFKHIPVILKIEKFFSYIPELIRKKIASIYYFLFESNRIIPSKIYQLLSTKHDLIKTYSLLRNIFPQSIRKKFLKKNSNFENVSNDLKLAEGENDNNFFNNISYLEINNYLKNTLLRDGDVMGMANGLEIRVPFLDRRIINFVAQIPSKFKTNKNKSKPLLIDIAKGQIGKDIWNIKKKGFSFPWDDWLRGDLSYIVDETFSDKNFWLQMDFNYDELKKIYSSFINKKKDITWVRVWIFVIFRKWCLKNL